MIPIKQTRIHDGSGQEPPGNCFAACVSSILELPLDGVPDESEFWEPGLHPRKSWIPYWEKFTTWLASIGMGFIEVNSENYWGDWTDVWNIASGVSPRDPNLLHAVVCFGGEMKHDPHPDNTGLVGKPKQIGFFVVIDPAKMIRRLPPIVATLEPRGI